MEAFDAYQHYLSMKLHFERDAYDYFKYNGKTNATFSAFEKRKDGFHFTKLTRKLSDDQIVEYYVANFIRGKKWIGDFDKRNWTQHKKVIQSVEYNFENDFEKLLTNAEKFDILFKCDNGNHPKLVKAYLGKKISLETLVILEKLLQYRQKFDKQIIDPYVWPEVSQLMRKYEPFLKVNIKKCNDIAITKVKELV
tara:strand:+ start:1425 stop:2009 length:585 start_codon:yes stop_codon:yes gene_type:complete